MALHFLGNVKQELEALAPRHIWHGEAPYAGLQALWSMFDDAQNRASAPGPAPSLEQGFATAVAILDAWNSKWLAPHLAGREKDRNRYLEFVFGSHKTPLDWSSMSWYDSQLGVLLHQWRDHFPHDKFVMQYFPLALNRERQVAVEVVKHAVAPQDSRSHSAHPDQPLLVNTEHSVSYAIMEPLRLAFQWALLSLERHKHEGHPAITFKEAFRWICFDAAARTIDRSEYHQAQDLLHAAEEEIHSAIDHHVHRHGTHDEANEGPEIDFDDFINFDSLGHGIDSSNVAASMTTRQRRRYQNFFS
ncbi:hypothetical protein OIO90_004305 [Microbotryomycetes sp. JL221]|nr:hypothetical protein OIO90_004305 [Microbotryomycetes sp. JL221]